MSRRRVYNQKTLDVIDRFFIAFDTLLEEKTLRGFQTYCRLYGIDKRHLYAQKMDHGRGYFEVYWLMPMITEYGISSDWLLFGKGQMRKAKTAGQKSAGLL